MHAESGQRRKRWGCRRRSFIFKTCGGASRKSYSRLLPHRHRFRRGSSLFARLCAESRSVGSRPRSLRFCICRHVCQRLDEHDYEHEHASWVRILRFLSSFPRFSYISKKIAQYLSSLISPYLLSTNFTNIIKSKKYSPSHWKVLKTRKVLSALILIPHNIIFGTPPRPRHFCKNIHPL